MAQTNVRGMEDHVIRKTERLFIGLGLKIFGAIALLIALGWGGHEVFQRVQERRLMKQARVSFDKKDDRWASIAARRVVELNPKNAEAYRLMADAVERQGSNAAVDLRRQVAKLRSDSLEDALAFARTALKFGDVATAERALSGFETKAQASAVFHQMEAEIALARKDSATAKTQFTEALRLDPANKNYRLNLAVLQFQSAPESERERAMLELQQFMEDPDLRKTAARALRDGALEQKDGRTGFETAQKLAGFPEADFRDRVSYVHMLRQLNHPDFAVRLLDLQTEAAAEPAKIYELLTWMSTSGQVALAMDWVKRLPPATTAKWPVAGAVAACHGAEKDWGGLEAWCRKTAEWADVDFLRHAALTRALREQSRTLDAEREWNLARKGAGTDGGRIHALQQKVAEWGWKQDSLDLLWLLTKDTQQQNDALRALFQNYATEGDTANLYRTVLRLSELRPDDPETENNLAQLSLLLNVERPRATRAARKLHEQDPGSAVFASTYAFALYSQGQFADALKAFSSVPAEALRAPAVAAYYGMVLASSGNKSAAREYLEIGKTAPLLPEERALLNRAAAAIPPSQ